MSSQLTSIQRVLAAVCLVGIAVPASANCSITHDTASPQVTRAFRANDGYTFKNYGEVCEKLRKANAQIFIHGTSGVLLSRSFGWASISIADKANPQLVITSFSSYSTQLDEYPGNDRALKSLWSAINNGLESWDQLDDALAKLRQARAQMSKPVSRKQDRVANASS